MIILGGILTRVDGQATLGGRQEEQFAPRLLQENGLLSEGELEEGGHTTRPLDGRKQQSSGRLVQLVDSSRHEHVLVDRQVAHRGREDTGRRCRWRHVRRGWAERPFHDSRFWEHQTIHIQKRALFQWSANVSTVMCVCPIHNAN